MSSIYFNSNRPSVVKAKPKVFKDGQVVEVCGSQENRTSRIGMRCRIIRRGLGNQYWVKFENEPEMIFRGAWLKEL